MAILFVPSSQRRQKDRHTERQGQEWDTVTGETDRQKKTMAVNNY